MILRLILRKMAFVALKNIDFLLRYGRREFKIFGTFGFVIYSAQIIFKIRSITSLSRYVNLCKEGKNFALKSNTLFRYNFQCRLQVGR